MALRGFFGLVALLIVLWAVALVFADAVGVSPGFSKDAQIRQQILTSEEQGPDRYRQDELVTQIRAADAAEWQAVLTLLELLLLCVTAVFAYLAVGEARFAAISTGEMLVAQKKGQTAWVSLDRFEINRGVPGAAGGQYGWWFTPALINTGTTPASSVICAAELKLIPRKDVGRRLNFTPTYTAGPMVIGPGRGVQAPGYFVTTEVIVKAASTGDPAIYLWGCAKYKDIFDQPHTTEWAMEVGFTGEVRDLSVIEIDIPNEQWKVVPRSKLNYMV
jgi:hypothetical protein